MTDVREITRKSRILERPPMSASVIPSARYSCDGSPERFFRGSTARELIFRRLASLVRSGIKTYPKVSKARNATTPKTHQRRARLAGTLDGSSSTGFGDETSSLLTSASKRALRLRTQASSSVFEAYTEPSFS